MNVHIVSYCLFARHAELVSASHIINNQKINKETLNPPIGGQGDDRFMMHNGYSK